MYFYNFSKFSEVDDIYARVGSEVLTKQNIADAKKKGFIVSSSIAHYVNTWVEKTLLYNAAIKEGLDKDKTLEKEKNDFYQNLLITSFLEIKSKKEINVSKKEVSNYYNKNKKSFKRISDEILLKHFVLSTKKEAKELKKLLKTNKKGDLLEKIVKKHKPEIKTIKKHLIEESLIAFIYEYSGGDVVGPKKINDSYHVFEILKKYEKDSIQGLEIVYDEIYQRLFKIKETHFLNNVLDSLYLITDVYISPEVEN